MYNLMNKFTLAIQVRQRDRGEGTGEPQLPPNY